MLTSTNRSNTNGALKRSNHYDYMSDFMSVNGDLFELDESFIAQYKDKKPNFGYNGLGEFVFYRTYSRLKSNGSKESFLEVLQRVVEGCYEIQRRHCRKIHIPWDYDKAQVSAQEMFERMWQFKFLPPGRGLWCMGTPFMFEKGGAALNNCGLVSTKDIAVDPAEPFCFLMDMEMLGVGIGFDTKGKDIVRIVKPANSYTEFIIPDSREGWVESVRMIIDSYTKRPELGKVELDYSKVRPAGMPIRGFGGFASGPAVLMDLHKILIRFFEARILQLMTSRDIVDLMNIIGAAVVAGNVRRTSEVAFGDADDLLYAEMKDYRKYPKECEDYRWASNNSVFVEVGHDYTKLAKQTSLNGEPGYAWLDNMRDFGRLIDGKHPGIDGRVAGANPCLEQSLEPYELCCLCETFPANHDSADDFLRTLKFAYLYAKTVTLLPTHNARTNSVMLRNRRIGLSQSGIIQAFQKFGRRQVLRDFCDTGYQEICRWDKIYSEWLCVPQSIKKTSVKPSGTVSLLCQAWPGIHHQEALSYWRRVRIAKDSPLVRCLIDAGYEVEPVITDPNRTVVVKFGIVEDQDLRPVSDVSVWEQVANVVDYQTYWADNQPSCTIKFKPEEASQIPIILQVFEDRLKAISFLPLRDHGYKQAPYEPASREEVEAYNARLRPIDYSGWIGDADSSVVKFCDGDTCQIEPLQFKQELSEMNC